MRKQTAIVALSIAQNASTKAMTRAPCRVSGRLKMRFGTPPQTKAFASPHKSSAWIAAMHLMRNRGRHCYLTATGEYKLQ